MNTLQYENGILTIIDQTKLPISLQYIECGNYKRVVEAISRLEVRGAPAIGAAAAYAMVLAAREFKNKTFDGFFQSLQQAKKEIAASRPTAVNLFWALEKVWEKAVKDSRDIDDIIKGLEEQANIIYDDDIFANKAMGRYGAAVLPEKCSILTHCNAGALATCGWGTALGVIREAFLQGKIDMVYADETRPLLQGARLTAWELLQDKIPVKLITDSMAGWVMKNALVQVVVTGADRIALNGDSANKIGTYTLAVLAKRHNIPFYIAAPKSTIDFSIKTGDEIPIEERSSAEVTTFLGLRSAPESVDVFNPAFDVTPNELITGIITEHGVLYPPFGDAILKIKDKELEEENNV